MELEAGVHVVRVQWALEYPGAVWCRDGFAAENPPGNWEKAEGLTISGAECQKFDADQPGELTLTLSVPTAGPVKVAVLLDKDP
jgi:hypothetical protein